MAVYQIAVCRETGEWEIIANFEAATDTEANQYAEDEYDEYEWYVLDATGRNING